MPTLEQVASWYQPNNGRRTLATSVVVPEVRAALAAWLETKEPGVLIGGLALSYWHLPRSTMDVDMLVEHLPTPPVAGFKKTRDHAWVHRITGVEVEVLDPSFLHLDPALATEVKHTAVLVGECHVASVEGLIALKLQRFSRQDQADIEKLVGLPLFSPERLRTFTLDAKARERLSEFKIYL